jgi:formylglycine-generating enzyme required for sulfatase activity
LAAPALAEEFPNSAGIEFVRVQRGAFFMGSDLARDSSASADETPRHKVTITRDFLLGKHEVTQEQWESVMGLNPSLHRGPRLPVELVTWEDAMAFVQRFNAREGIKSCRLPTEAEWEYAARAGTETLWHFGSDREELGRYAWHLDNSGGETHEAGSLEPNQFGLYDMLGNVWEHTADWYDVYRELAPASDPKGPEVGLFRVVRGGSWEDGWARLRSASRYFRGADAASDFTGFRLACSIGDDSPGLSPLAR